MNVVTYPPLIRAGGTQRVSVLRAPATAGKERMGWQQNFTALADDDVSVVQALKVREEAHA